MSIVDLDSLSPKALVAQYVVEVRGGGAFLPYLDYEVIDDWIAAAKTTDHLLLILSEELPKFFQRPGRSTQPRSIRGVRRRVLKLLKENALHLGGRDL